MMSEVNYFILFIMWNLMPGHLKWNHVRECYADDLENDRCNANVMWEED